jgi:hypothetical protein
MRAIRSFLGRVFFHGRVIPLGLLMQETQVVFREGRWRVQDRGIYEQECRGCGVVSQTVGAGASHCPWCGTYREVRATHMVGFAQSLGEEPSTKRVSVRNAVRESVR